MESQEHPKVAAGRRERVYAGTGLSWGFVAFVVLAAAVILFVAQNTDRVRVEWAFWDFEASLAGVVLMAMLAAVILTSLVGLAWRRSRRRKLTERERVLLLEQEVTSLRAGADQEEEPAHTQDDGSAPKEEPLGTPTSSEPSTPPEPDVDPARGAGG